MSVDREEAEYKVLEDYGERFESIIRKLDEISGKLGDIYDLVVDEGEDLLLEHPPKRRPPDFSGFARLNGESQLDWDFKKNFFQTNNKNPFN